jgi:protein SCO1/2
MPRRRHVSLLLAALVLGACGSSSVQSSTTRSRAVPTADTRSNSYQGLVLRPQKAAPPLALRNYTGGPPVSLAALHGKAVFVTFVYTHCPDVCPIIVASLAAAHRQLGSRAAGVKILAVTVDPRRDTPGAIRTFLRERNATGRVDYLLGNSAQLLRTWKAWGVAVVVDKKQVLAGHSSIIYGITASGRMAVAYPANVTPQQIIHDVPLLARS